MAEPTTPASPFKKPKKGAQKAVSPFTKPGQKAAAKTDLNPVLSFGQSVIDVLSTPMYAVEGGIAAGLDGKNPLQGAAENAISWAQGKRPITGSELLKKAGMDNNFWSSLAADIVLDPLTYTPGVVLSAPLKAAGIAGRSAVKAGAAAAKGTTKTVEFLKKPTMTWKGMEAPATQISKASPSQQAFLQKFINKQAAVKTAEPTWKYDVKITSGDRTAVQAVNDVLANSLIAGKNAFVSTILSEGAKNTLRKYAAREAKIGRKLGADLTPEQAAKAAEETVLATTKAITPAEVAKNITKPEAVGKVGKTLITDVAPVAATSEIRKIAAMAPKTNDVTRIKKLLDNLDVESKKATVTTQTKVSPVDSIKRIINTPYEEAAARIAELAPENLRPIKDAIAVKRNPFDVYRELATSNLLQRQHLAFAINKDLNFRSTDGKQIKFSEYASKYADVPISQIPTDILGEATRMLKSRFVDITNPKYVAELRKNKLLGVVDTNTLKELEKAGAFSGTVNNPAVAAILAALPKAGETVSKKYESFDQLIAGLKAGDSIDTKSLEKIFKLVDPDAELIKQIDTTVPKEIGLKALLTGPAVKTVQDSQKMLTLLTADEALSAQGLGFADTAATYLKGILDGQQNLTPAIERQTRTKAAEQLTEYVAEGGKIKLAVTDAVNSLSRALDGTLDEIVTETEKGNIPVDRISSLGDYVRLKFDKAYVNKNKAYRNLETNENFATKLYGSILAKQGARNAKAKVQATPTELLNRFGVTVELAETASVAILGTHLIVKASRKATEGDAAHTLLLHYGDLIKAFKGIDTTLSLERALFPMTKTASDSVSHTGLMDAVRMAVESYEKDLPFPKEEIVARILSTGQGQEKWSAGFKARMPQIAEDIATNLHNPEILKRLEDAHTLRMLADIEDGFQPAIAMRQEMFDALINGWRANNQTGVNSSAARLDLVSEWFNKFALASGILRQEYGAAAEETLRQASLMFIKDGKINDITKAQLLPEDPEEWGAFLETLNSYFKTVNPHEAAPLGKEHLKFPTKTGKNRAEIALTDAKLTFETLVKEAQDFATRAVTKADIADWNKRFNKATKDLNKARSNAADNWLPTQHWDGKKWVPTELYNHATAVKNAEALRTITTTEGLAKLDNISDTPAPKEKPLTAQEIKTGIAAQDKATKRRTKELAETHKQEAAQHAIDVEKQIDEILPDPEDAVLRQRQEADFHALDAAGKINVIRYRANYGKNPRNVVPGEETTSFLRRTGAKLSATFGVKETRPILNEVETTVRNSVQKLSAAANDIRDKWKGQFEESVYVKAFTDAINEVEPKDIPDPLIAEMVGDIRSITDIIYKELASKKIPSDMLKKAFARFDLLEKDGFKAPGKTNPTKILSDLPFTQMPEGYEGTIQAADWAQRAESFKKSVNADPFVAIARLAQAIEFAKGQNSLGANFAVRWGHQAQGLTLAQAVEQGWKKIEAIPGSGTDLSISIPEGTLFHPYIAEQFGWLNKEANELFESNTSPLLRTVMDITGFFKATQTILRPGHHITNAVGDISTALIAGARNPNDWARAIRLSMRYASESARADYFKNGLPERFAQLFRAIENVGGRKTVVKTAEEGPIKLYIGGKRISITEDEFIQNMEARNGVIDNMVVSDTQGFYESVLGDVTNKATEGAEKDLNKRIAQKTQDALLKIKQPYHKAIKPFGDFAAAYGNAPRMAHALSVMQSRQWANPEQMWDAVNDAMNRFHPTIQSLSSWERKYPRSIFTYYTWLRVAHNALINMAANHSSAMTAYSKVQYNQAQAAGLEPGSVGSPWGNKKLTPGYIDYSVYGPTTQGPRGPMLYKPAILPLDVLDNYNLVYDPAYTMEQNAFNNAKNLGQGLLGKNVNVLAQVPIEMLTGTSMATGKPSQVKDAASAMDRLMSMFGQTTLLKGLGLYTPSNKGPDSANPLTQRDRDLLLKNYFTGLKEADVNTPANVKNAQSEQTARQNAFLQQYIKGLER